MSIAYNTLSGTSLFKQDILDSFVLHIPHSSTHIPDYTRFDMEKVQVNIDQLTDWATDEIFNVGDVEKIVTPFSRLFCDVERFDDDVEPMLQIGRGFYYTNGYDGSDLRSIDPVFKDLVQKEYYETHHRLFYEKVKDRLDKIGVCHILDCHSFNDIPVGTLLENPKSPDICIGTDPFHTPDYLLNYAFKYFANAGYSVEINNPYSGCIIPKPYFNENSNVKGLMVEFNKRTYMNDTVVDRDKVEHLRILMQGFFESL